MKKQEKSASNYELILLHGKQLHAINWAKSSHFSAQMMKWQIQYLIMLNKQHPNPSKLIIDHSKGTNLFSQPDSYKF